MTWTWEGKGDGGCLLALLMLPLTIARACFTRH